MLNIVITNAKIVKFFFFKEKLLNFDSLIRALRHKVTTRSKK